MNPALFQHKHTSLKLVSLTYKHKSFYLFLELKDYVVSNVIAENSIMEYLNHSIIFA